MASPKIVQIIKRKNSKGSGIKGKSLSLTVEYERKFNWAFFQTTKGSSSPSELLSSPVDY